MPARRSPRHHDHAFVVRQSDRVCNEPGFRNANRACDVTRPFVDVGVTALDPDVRFDRQPGIHANRFVPRYGERLVPQRYEVNNPMPHDAARDMAVEPTTALRQAGHGVWQA